MINYDIQQVCLKGHQITDSYNSEPALRKDFCDECGSKTIIACPECSHPIQGAFRVDGAFVFTPTSVPDHCQKCGKQYPWVRNYFAFYLSSWLRLSSVFVWYNRRSMFEKIGFWGSIASIIGLCWNLFPSLASSQHESKIQASSVGARSPAIGTNQGTVTINYGSPLPLYEKSYVLRNSKSGATLIVSRPSMDAIAEPQSHVCMVPAGTPISLTGETAKLNGIDMWRKIKVLSGEFSGKVGWTTIENVSFE